MNKLHSLKDLKQKIAQWRLKSDTIVFTNGCFDIVHVGHIHVLQEAKSKGDKLIVALNSDQSVKRLKGKTRPINQENDRVTVIEALSVVDAVIIFEEDTPLKLIKELKPDVLVKGGDYCQNEIVGAPEVIQNGGKVIIVPFLKAYSSTSIINKLNEE